jgi:hypothetical protein
MLKSALSGALSAALLTWSFSAIAVDWQQDFFSPQTNELPPLRGVRVDDQGFVHLQAYNRFISDKHYFLSHQYTIRADGQIPWIWGLSQVDRMSDCGVYARAGQRLDCSRRRSRWFWDAEETVLQMHSTQSSNLVWETTLPGEVHVVDAAIQQPNPNEALILGRIDSPDHPSLHELGVFRANSHGPAEVLSVIQACPHPGQTLTMLRSYVPKQAWEPIRVIKACWNSFGTTDLFIDEFNPQTQQWTMRPHWPLPYGTWLAQAELGPQGQAYALIEDGAGFRQMLTAPAVLDYHWWAMPLPTQGKVAAFMVGDKGAALVSMAYAQSSSSDIFAYPHYDVTWFDDSNGWPMITMQPLQDLGGISPKAFALSSEGDMLIVGSPQSNPAHALPDQLLFVSRNRDWWPIAQLWPLLGETDIGNTYLIGGPNHVAVIARTIYRDTGNGQPEIGVRVNQYDLPASW